MFLWIPFSTIRDRGGTGVIISRKGRHCQKLSSGWYFGEPHLAIWASSLSCVCLNLNWFASLEDARSTVAQWRDHYNHVRPHRSLGKKPTAVFAQEAA